MKRIVGVGPSIIDVAARLPERDLVRCLEAAELEPGQWRRIDQATVEAILEIVLGAGSVLSPEAELPANVVVRPGSTIANALLAIPGDELLDRALITALAVSSGRLDPMTRLFTEVVQAAGITHHGVPVAGHNPVVFVLSGTRRTERSLAMYPGIADELDRFDLSSQSPSLVMVDAFNLGDHPLGRWIASVVLTGEFPIMLSLGNYNILTGRLAHRIRSFLDDGLVTAVCGNLAEFRSLFAAVGGGGAASVEALLARIGAAVPYVLITRGPDGMVTSWRGQRVAAPASPIRRAEIRSTAGAGDAAAGLFAAGIVQQQDPMDVLERAAGAAAQALRRL